MASEEKVLIINHPAPHRVRTASKFISAHLSDIDWHSYKDFNVIVLPCESPDFVAQALTGIEATNPTAQKLVSANAWLGEGLRKIYDSGASHVHLCNFESEDFDNFLRAAIDRQSTEFNKLNKTARTLKRSDTIKSQVESLQRALMAVLSAQSISEIELYLFAALGAALDLQWVRIFIFTGDHFEEQLKRFSQYASFNAQLRIGGRNLGRIIFARQSKKSFSKSEIEKLNQITESVSLALDRFAKLDSAETLKLQWDSTFDAITDPLCLTDSKFNIIRTNQAFLKLSGLSRTQATDKNCFQLLGSDKSLNDFEITTQPIETDEQGEKMSLIIFHDISEQRRIEKQILESSKMAELGTIGSSIAHDINNPLGGMINFLQLIKMDVPSNDPLREDIDEMEAAGQRCKEIVESLLRFSRRQDYGSPETVDAQEVLSQAIKIIELQSRSRGIKIDFDQGQTKVKIMGHFALLSQAFNYILQNAVEAISDKLAAHPGEKGEIKIQSVQTAGRVEIVISDNGVGISPEHQSKILNPLFSTKILGQNQGLGLTMAYQIIRELNGQLDISSRPNVGTEVKISFMNV